MDRPLLKSGIRCVEAKIRVWNIQSDTLTDQTKCPCDQNTPEDISFDIFNNQSTGDDDTDDRKQQP